MTMRPNEPAARRLHAEAGTTLIETMFACAILTIVMAGLMMLSGVALSTTENQGHLGAREAEYAVDKMEQLQQLAYSDAQSDTTLFPSVDTGGTGLAIGGSSTTSAPVVGYTDYLDANGNVLCTGASPCTATPPTNWYYIRVWRVSSPAANLKQITVSASARMSMAGSPLQTSTVTSLKTNCPTTNGTPGC